MAMQRREREQPPWLEPLQLALLEALPRLYGEAIDGAVAGLIGELVVALEQGILVLPLPPGAAAERLAGSALCRAPDGPLVIEAGQVGWRRWHALRGSVLAALLERVAPLNPQATPGPGSSTQVPPSPAAESLDPRQRQAVQAVHAHRLVLLQGGPGTGKTSTVARMLAAVLERDPATRVHLAAPTGKAAARLRTATGGAHPCGTLHRLLESRGDHFARNRRHPLPLDLLVVDEVSMVDLQLMAALLEALPAAARLVLVGDPAQLPPIAPGAVLLDLQQPDLQAALGPAAITLTTTYRNNGAIAAVAAALRASMEPPDPPALSAAADAHPDPSPLPTPGSSPLPPLELIRPLLAALGPSDNLLWQPAPTGRLPADLRPRLELHLQALAALAARCRPERPAGWRALLAERDRLLVLSPLRRGPWGVEAIHRALLGEAAVSGSGSTAAWPEGLPVLCTRNLPELGLANGDVGVLVGAPGAADRQLLFAAEEPLWVHPAQLAGAAEPALALTVHKAQGSEAAEVIVLLSDGDADARLLYTALTRARERAVLITPP